MTSGMKNKIINKARSTVRSDLATMVRLAFHDCVGNIAVAVAVVAVVAVVVAVVALDGLCHPCWCHLCGIEAVLGFVGLL